MPRKNPDDLSGLMCSLSFMSPKSNTCDQLVKLFETAPIRKSTGMTLRYDAEARAIFEMRRNPNFDHALGDTHGGLIATLLDNAGWFTVAAHYETWVVTSDLTIRLLEAAGQSDLVATGRIVRAGKVLSVAEMEVRTSKNILVATGSGSFVVTSKSIQSPVS